MVRDFDVFILLKSRNARQVMRALAAHRRFPGGYAIYEDSTKGHGFGVIFRGSRPSFQPQCCLKRPL